MAKLRFFKGSVVGRLGEIVGSTWKGINYLKTYSKPANPKTPDQLAVRAVFRAVSGWAKALLVSGFGPLIPAAPRLTPRNVIFKANAAMFAAKVFSPNALKVAPANFDPSSGFSLAATYNGSTGKLDFSGNYSLAPDAPPDTKLHLLLYSVAGQGIAAHLISNGGVVAETVNVGPGFPTANFRCFAVATGTGANGKALISQTSHLPIN